MEQHISDHIRESCLRKAGLGEPLDMEEVRRSQWSDRFAELMHNRLVMGLFRYGPLGGSGLSIEQRMEDARMRLRKFEETGNKEYLVDAANACLCTFVENEGHFRAVDRDGRDD